MWTPNPCHGQRVLAVVGIAALLLLGVALSPVLFEAVVSCKHWFMEGGVNGALCFSLIFSLGMVAMLPYTPFCIACGYIWGLTVGILVQTLAIFLSSGCIYGVGGLIKHYMPMTLIHNREWTKLLIEIDDDWRKGAKINLLLCFIPMPYGTHVYIFALSDHAFLAFVTVFELGMIGHTLLNLGIGTILASHGEAAAHPLKMWGTVASITVMTVATCFAGTVAQRQLDYDAEPDDVFESICSQESLIESTPSSHKRPKAQAIILPNFIEHKREIIDIQAPVCTQPINVDVHGTGLVV
jgi:uncharacterized membrane protein YdjX (TVP38/TMEM64 family)